MHDLRDLAARVAVPGRVAVEVSALGGPVVRLSTGEAQAVIALHGAHVLDWRIAGEPLLWLSPAATIREGKGIRGGIPVCWPWFGDHRTDKAKPAHGFVRQRPWDVVRSDVAPEAATIVLAAATSEADRALWPHRAAVELCVTLGTGLGLSLTTRNTGEAPLPLTQALHTYFRVAEIERVRVTGLGGVTYLDKLTGFARKTQDGVVTFTNEVDRIYLGATDRIVLDDAVAARKIEITSLGSRSAVVWNPWGQKTARLGDMGAADAFRQMLCIETANAGDDVVTLTPGGCRVLGAAYRVGE